MRKISTHPDRSHSTTFFLSASFMGREDNAEFSNPVGRSYGSRHSLGSR
ncbi:MAG: hypothetical protein ABI763_05285 [Bacteroidota bacterium]